eukprot:UN32896
MGMYKTLSILPAPCKNPGAPSGLYLTEFCGENFRLKILFRIKQMGYNIRRMFRFTS